MPLATGYPYTGSIIEGPNGQDRTGTAISTNIVIQVNNTAVGAIQTLSVREQRTITMIDEVGTDGHIDSVPTKSTDISGECRRIRYDLLRVGPAFSRDFFHVASQRIPFDIVIQDRWNGDGSNAIITTIKNVWIQSIGYAYNADNWLIIDDMSWVAEDIFSTLNGGLAATSGPRGFTLQQDTIEQATDQGSFRGSLSAPGLINEFFSNG
jgi:hypothetical protein